MEQQCVQFQMRAQPVHKLAQPTTVLHTSATNLHMAEQQQQQPPQMVQQDQQQPSATATQKTVYILRGISGSGKSTLAKSLFAEHGLSELLQLNPRERIFSADDYFVNKQTQQYEFDGAKIGRAHEWNQRRAFDAMGKGLSPLVVDNTNTQLWEMKPYVEVALQHGYAVLVREPQTPWAKDASELAKRNIHSVPLESIQRMLARWEMCNSLDDILNAETPKRAQKKPSTRGQKK